MLDFSGELIRNISGFCVDLLLMRKLRAARGRPERALSEDALEMALFEWWWMYLVAVAALICSAVLYFGFDLPLWISLGGPLLLGGLYCAYYYWRMIDK